MATWAINKFVGLVLQGEANEVADQRADSELAPLGFRDVHEHLHPKDSEVRDIGLVSALSFFWHYTIKGLCGCNVVDVGSVSKGIVPIGQATASH